MLISHARTSSALAARPRAGRCDALCGPLVGVAQAPRSAAPAIPIASALEVSISYAPIGADGPGLDHGVVEAVGRRVLSRPSGARLLHVAFLVARAALQHRFGAVPFPRQAKTR